MRTIGAILVAMAVSGCTDAGLGTLGYVAQLAGYVDVAQTILGQVPAILQLLGLT